MSEQNTKDYPEHLNPFKKPTGIRSSFRKLKRSLRQSFKWGQEKKPEVVRREPPVGAVNYNGHSGFESIALRSTDNVHRSQTLMLPRSRFTERVNQTKTLCLSTIPLTTPTDKSITNPFEAENSDEKIKEESQQNPFNEEQENVKPQEEKEYGKGTIRRHRRKKRAPLPPGLKNSENGFLSVPDINNSKWSLNSYDTDCSVYTYGSESEDVNENDNFEPNKNELKDIKEMSVEIQKYYNANIDSSEPKTDANNIHETDLTLKKNTDIVIVNVIENVSENSQKEDNSSKNVSHSNIKHQKYFESTSTNERKEETVLKDNLKCSETDMEEDLESTKKFEKEEISTDAQNIEILQGCEIKILQLETESSSDKRTEVNEGKVEKKAVENVEEETKESQITIENNVNKKDEKKDENKGDGVKEDNGEVGMETYMRGNEEEVKEPLQSIQTGIVSTHDSEEFDYKNNNIHVVSEPQSYDDELNYCSTNDIYIAASTDNLNDNYQILFNERKSLYITGSRDELNNDPNNEIIERNESPVPKVRKHKLSKSALLGTPQDN